MTTHFGQAEECAGQRVAANEFSDRLARWIVWTVWLLMVLGLIAGMARWSSPIPLAEDWLLVAPVTGHEPNLWQWAWAQNNEHRSPVSRLIILAMLKATHGDFRVGGYFSIALLAAVTALILVATRRVRGRTDVADIFFPLVLLHFGHSGQFLFGWQVTFVLPVTILIIIACVLFSGQSVGEPLGAVFVGSGLVLLPLCGGGNGLLYVPALSAFLVYAGWNMWGGKRGWAVRRSLAVWLFGSSALAMLVSILYFVGYEKPTWNPAYPGVVPSMKTALRVLTLGFGPAAARSHSLFLALALLLIAASGVCALIAWRRQHGFSRDRTLGAVLFLVNAVGVACLVGWVRAGFVPKFGIPTRYMLLVAPAFCACFLALELFAIPSIGQRVQRIAAAIMLVLLPFNTVAGYTMFADWYNNGMRAVRADLVRGLPLDQIASRHQAFLIHWWDAAELARQMQWLREAGIKPFHPLEEGRLPFSKALSEEASSR